MAHRRIDVHRSKRREWAGGLLRQRYYSTITAENGKTTFTSEMYVRRIDALDEANRTAQATFTVHDHTSLV